MKHSILGLLILSVVVAALAMTTLSGCGEDRHHRDVYVERERGYDQPYHREGRDDGRNAGDRRNDGRNDGDRRDDGRNDGDRHDDGGNRDGKDR